METKVSAENGILRAEINVNHQHDFGARPLARLRAVKGYDGPIEEWVCACGFRRIMAAGVSPHAPVGEIRNVAYNELQDHNERSLFYGTGQMGHANPAMWLTEQENKANG